MKEYIKEASSKTPAIKFDMVNGVLDIKGRSIPENCFEFYKPLMAALDVYSGCAQPTTVVTLDLEYFSTSSSKCILDVFKKLENISKGGKSVTVNWNYEDEDILEAGEDYQAMIDLPFQMVLVSD